MNKFYNWIRRHLRIGRKYRDNLFCAVFSSNKQALLELYNALNGTSYDNPNELEIVTLENALYISHKNDLAFLLSGTINLYEHQSTENPNMPVQFLIYLAEEYQKIIEASHLSLYGTTIIPLPAPRFVVFYNGIKDFTEKEYQLSDAFIDNNAESDLSLKVKVVNINLGYNESFMKQCKTLEEYAQLMELVKKYQEKYDLKTALNMAIEEAINNGILEDFLRQNRAEVLGMVLYDFDKKKYERTLREEGRIEGRTEGISIGRTEGISIGRSEGGNHMIYKLVSQGKLSIQDGADELNITKEKLIDNMTVCGYKLPE